MVSTLDDDKTLLKNVTVKLLRIEKGALKGTGIEAKLTRSGNYASFSDDDALKIKIIRANDYVILAENTKGWTGKSEILHLDPKKKKVVLEKPIMIKEEMKYTKEFEDWWEKSGRTKKEIKL